MTDRPTDPNLINTLRERGLLYQCTDENALRAHLATPQRVYCGFDPTADSLTVGNLVPIVALSHFQQAGHTPVVVMGGGTGLIGDPSGKSAERQLMSDEMVAANVRSQSRIFHTLLDFSEGAHNRAVMVNNAEWLAKIGFIDVLRTVGKHLSVNEMIKRDSVRDRLAREQGISYTEFSYMVLQAYDFLYLFQRHGVTMQIGGSDQWGNMIAGADLIKKASALSAESAVMAALESGTAAAMGNPRAAAAAAGRTVAAMARAAAPSPHVMTMPLVTKADGGKFGKSESGAVWLTAERTTPYAFYQFWLNAHDNDVLKFLRLFSLMPMDEIAALEAAHRSDPAKREAHRALARHMTTLIHGESALAQAEGAAGALFGSAAAGGDAADFTTLDRKALSELFASAPTSDHPRTALAGEGVSLVDLLPLTSLAKSKREAREHLAAGAVAVNGRRVGPDDRLTDKDLLHNEVVLLRRGKKSWHVTRWR